MMPASGLLLSALLLVLGPAWAAEVVVQVTRSDEALEVQATAEFRGEMHRTWQVLTGYERYADFIPDMHLSRVVVRDGSRVEVEQKGEARILFIGFPIDVRMSVIEYPRERIVSRATAGNFREMLGEYRLEEGRGRMKLHYTGRLVPDFIVPPVIGTLVFRHNIETSFRALVGEIERRHAQPGPPKGE
jgi:hypothetical protein